MANVRAEFTVEPFVEGAPGGHVRAAIDAATRAGFQPDVGPFGTAIRGEPEAVSQALQAVVQAAIEAGASRVSIQVDRLDGNAA